VVASDAFFPFRDGLDVVVDAGATCVIQPGGSMRDQEVIDAANERGVAMVFSGVRHFRDQRAGAGRQRVKEAGLLDLAQRGQAAGGGHRVARQRAGLVHRAQRAPGFP
jgi:hypothetical protein